MSYSQIRPALLALAALITTACVQAAPAASADTATTTTAAALAAATPAAAEAAGTTPLLAEVHRVTRRFRDIDVALREGYVREGECVELPGVGAMGVHYMHPRLAGQTTKDGRIHGTDAELDPTKPELLIYEPQADGSMELVAVEWYTSKEAWGDRPAPNLFGVPFNEMFDDPATAEVDEGHGFTPHYDQHVWIYRHNVAGTFAQWNAGVSCEHAPTAPATAHAGH